jgi:hypothetical protein
LRTKGHGVCFSVYDVCVWMSIQVGDNGEVATGTWTRFHQGVHYKHTRDGKGRVGMACSGTRKAQYISVGRPAVKVLLRRCRRNGATVIDADVGYQATDFIRKAQYKALVSSKMNLRVPQVRKVSSRLVRLYKVQVKLCSTAITCRQGFSLYFAYLK